MSGPRKNRRTSQFKDSFGKLPPKIQRLAAEVFKLFAANPDHPSLRRHKLKDTDKGQHRQASISVTISMQYRAIYVEDGDTNVWYWIGSHADYDSFTGRI